MAVPAKKSPAEWFAEAADWYVQGHQACVACSERHCVFHKESTDLVEFYCYSCDFSVCHDLRTDRYYVWDKCLAEPRMPAVLQGLGQLIG